MTALDGCAADYEIALGLAREKDIPSLMVRLRCIRNGMVRHGRSGPMPKHFVELVDDGRKVKVSTYHDVAP